MKFALVNGQRQEAEPKARGECPACGSPMVAHCGERKVWHWAHKAASNCDPWWENETPWHRDWKNQFPEDWQEIVQYADDGERHIADVKTADGWAIEFQHSYIKPEERRSRDAFYGKLIWVVDGLRRKTDKDRFLKAWEEGSPIGAKGPMRRAFSDDCRLLQEWSGSPGPVFFDFGEDHMLGWLLAKRPDGPVYIAPFQRAMFIGIHRGMSKQATNDFDSLVEDIDGLISNYEAHHRAQARNRVPPLPGRSRVRRRRHPF